ncbi:MAG TPA: MFS transporter [Candidatus Aphodovivens avistercoris]|nr:MFS transporter [Candidatus Aphodovivens avistercoris]
MSKQQQSTMQPKTIWLFGILGIASVTTCFVATNPALSVLGEHYAGQNYTMLSSIHTVATFFMTLITGVLISSGRMKYRLCAILGTAIMFISGTLPGIVPDPSFEFALGCRLVFGVGVGFVTPLMNSLILNIYSGDKQSRYTGWVQTVKEGGSVVFQMLGGFLAAQPNDGWHMSFLAFGLCLVGVIAAFFVPEPPKEIIAQKAAEKRAAAQAAGGDGKAKLGIACFVIAFFLFLYSLLQMSLQMNVATMFSVKFASDSVASATALSCKTVFGMLAGIAFGFLFKFNSRIVLPIACFAGCLSGILFRVAGDPIMGTVATCGIGFGFATFMPSAMMLNGKYTHPARIAMGTSIILAAANISNFCSSLYMGTVANIFGGGDLKSIATIDALCVIAAVVYFAMAILFLVWNPFKGGRKPAPAEAPAAEASGEGEKE